VYDNKTKLKVHISQFEADNSIFDKIQKKIKLNNKIKNRVDKKLKGKLDKNNFKSKNTKYKVNRNQVDKNMNQSINKNKYKIFTNMNSIDIKTDIKSYQRTLPLPLLGLTPENKKKKNININSNQIEIKDKNLPNINTGFLLGKADRELGSYSSERRAKTRSINMNNDNKFNQNSTLIKEDITGRLNFDNYNAKPYNKNKETGNYQSKTDYYIKLGNENSTYKSDNRSNVRFKDNINRKNNVGPSFNVDANVYKAEDSNISNKNNITNYKERIKNNDNIRKNNKN
jgi:hypothetical protein